LVALDVADQQGIDQHVVRRALARQHLGEGHAGGPRHRRRRAAGLRGLCTGIEDIDDAAPASRLHARKSLAAEPDRGQQLQVDVMLPDLVGDLDEGPTLRCAGVVDEHVDVAERLVRCLECGAAAGGRANVGSNGDDLGIGLAGDLCLGLVQALLLARDDRHVGTRLGEVARDGQADALAATRDERIAPVHA